MSLKTELSLYDNEEYIEPELDDSVFNPANSEYKRTTTSLRRMMRHLADTMRPKHAMVAKLLVTGTFTLTQIAKRIRTTPQSVTNIKQRPDVRELVGILRELNTLTGGTKSIEREMMLWGIAHREEEVDPRTAIAAIAEINKMRTDTEAAQAKIAQNTTITDNPNIIIQLADPRLLPSPLDNPQIKDVN